MTSPHVWPWKYTWTIVLAKAKLNNSCQLGVELVTNHVQSHWHIFICLHKWIHCEGKHANLREHSSRLADQITSVPTSSKWVNRNLKRCWRQTPIEPPRWVLRRLSVPPAYKILTSWGGGPPWFLAELWSRHSRFLLVIKQTERPHLLFAIPDKK